MSIFKKKNKNVSVPTTPVSAAPPVIEAPAPVVKTIAAQLTKLHN